MKKILKTHQLLSSILGIMLSVFLVSVSVYAVTTIGTNIQTAGTASSTSATTTDYLYVGPDGTEESTFDFSGGDLYVADDAEVDGDLYVTGASTFTGLATLDHASSTSATTTDYLYVGPDGTETNFDFSGGDIYVADDVEIMGGLWTDSATTTDSLAIGGYASSTGDMNTQGSSHIGGDLTLDGEITAIGSTTASIINMTSIKFTPAATPTPVVTGECFVTSDAAGENQLKCYDGSAWQEAW